MGHEVCTTGSSCRAKIPDKLTMLVRNGFWKHFTKVFNVSQFNTSKNQKIPKLVPTREHALNTTVIYRAEVMEETLKLFLV